MIISAVSHDQDRLNECFMTLAKKKKEETAVETDFTETLTHL